MICDTCEEEKEIVTTIKDKDYCDECYSKHSKGIPQELIDDWGDEMAEKLVKYKSFITLNYESFNYYDDDSKSFAKELNIAFEKIGANIKAIPDHTDDNVIIGFEHSE